MELAMDGNLFARISLDAFVVFGAFFVTRPIFGGTLYDTNGYLPFQPPIGRRHWRWDVNVTAFTILSAVLFVGILAIR